MNDIPKRALVMLEGSPFNRGVTHGRRLKEEINRLVADWKGNLKKQYGTDPDEYIAKFLDKTNYSPAIEKYTPGLLEEVRGISEGSGIDFDTIYAFQLLDEFLLNAEDIHREHCSTIGSNRTNGKPAMMGQNWDIAGSLDGFQTVLHIKEEDSDLESFVFSYTGLVAAFGMNNKGVGVCVNSIGQLNYSREGLPIAFVIRGILKQSNQMDAVKFLHKVKHASPQNYLIGGPEKIYDFECSTNTIAPFTVTKNADVVYHTNHALANNDYNSKYLEDIDKNGEEHLKNDNSHIRFHSLSKLLNVPAEEVTVDKIKSVLSSHDSEAFPVCMDYKDSASIFSFGSTVMVFSDDPEFHIAFGPPDVRPYKVHKFGKGGIVS